MLERGIPLAPLVLPPLLWLCVVFAIALLFLGGQSPLLVAFSGRCRTSTLAHANARPFPPCRPEMNLDRQTLLTCGAQRTFEPVISGSVLRNTFQHAYRRGT